MLTERLQTWLRDQHITESGNFLPLWVEIDPRQVRIILADKDSSQQWLDFLATQLTLDWGREVLWVVYPWSNQAIERLQQIFSLTGSGMAQLLTRENMAMSQDGIVVSFPNKMTYTLFEQWGGLHKLRQYWPDMPPWQDQVLEALPSEPDPVMPVNIEPSMATQSIIGNGAPSAAAKDLQSLPDTGEVVVAGQIVTRDIRTGRDNLKHWSAVITDMVHALRIRYSEKRGQAFPDLSPFISGAFIKVQGQMEEDKYTGEHVLRVKHAGLLPPRTTSEDNALDKRVELHVHSRMSTGDGLIALPELFQRLKDWGHSHVAVVDHGVVQTYPELEFLSKKTGIQAIYGVEIYMVEDNVAPLSGYEEMFDGSLDSSPLVVLDVETTGLSPRVHEVIELGAVKIDKGEIVDRFHSMVRPERNISQATQDITGIRPEEVMNAPSAPEVFQDFFAFASGSILVAHNARFDVGFLAAAFSQVFPEDDWRFPVIDTLALARTRLPHLKSHGLGPLTNYLKIPLSQHHRALADAEATGLLLLKLLQKQDGAMDSLDSLKEPSPLSFSLGRPTPVTLLLKSQDGVEELYRLISESHLSTFYRIPRVPRRYLELGRKNWFIGSPLHGGEMQDALFRGALDEDLTRLQQFYDYWEVGPLSTVQFLSQDEQLGSHQEVRQYLKDLIDLGRRYHKPTPAVCDAHYIQPEQKIFREILSVTGKGDLHDAQESLHMRSTGEMLEEFDWLDPDLRQKVVVKDPRFIAEQIPPLKPVPDGLFSPKLEEAEKTVQEFPVARAKALYGDPLPDIIQSRLEKEIRSIVQNGFSSIYYIAHRLVKKSLDDGYLVGSRGSVGSSLVATFLDITEVNPLPPHYRCPECRYTEFVKDTQYGSGFDLPSKDCPKCHSLLVGEGQDIPFETFLGFEGDKVPDIDLNFSGEYQPEIHKYTEVLFGEGHVFRAGTIATIAQKTAMALVLAWAREKGRELSGAEEEWLASGITGVKRTTGQHPGGLMVVPQDEDIHHFCPVQRPADDRNSETITTHFDYHSIEGRLLKLDLLGHDDPTAIRMLEDITGISAKNVPFHDDKTMSLFRNVKALGVKAEEIGTPVGSLGIPEFGTSFVRRMLMDTKPKTFAELVRISGLSHGTEVWANNAQDIIRQNLGGLSDVIATRDDIMLYLIGRDIEPKAAFAISESVRKGRGLKPEQERLMKEHHVSQWYIESCRKISYLFPKAHAAAYVMMGWRIAWFKVHYPLAFYATYFSVRASDFDPETILDGIKGINKRMADIEDKGYQASAKEKGLVTVLEIARELLARGYNFFPVSLEKSHAVRFTIENDGLRIPFAALPGLGQSAAENIIQARQGAPFLSVDDLRQRAKLSKSVIDLLRNQGALRGLGETNQLAFF